MSTSQNNQTIAPNASNGSNPRSQSRGRDSHRNSRPTTPLRHASRESLRNRPPLDGAALPIDALKPQFAELEEAMYNLHDNFIQLQQVHESIAKFNENFASLMYGLNMNAFCVDFTESPMPESFRLAQMEAETIGGQTRTEIVSSAEMA